MDKRDIFLLIMGFGVGISIIAIVVYMKKENRMLNEKIIEMNKKVFLLEDMVSINNKLYEEIITRFDSNEYPIMHTNNMTTQTKEEISKNEEINKTVDNDNELWDIERNLDGSIKSVKIRNTSYTITN